MIVDTVVLRKFRAACVYEITVLLAMRETEYNGGRFGCFTAGDVKAAALSIRIRAGRRAGAAAAGPIICSVWLASC